MGIEKFENGCAIRCYTRYKPLVALLIFQHHAYRLISLAPKVATIDDAAWVFGMPCFACRSTLRSRRHCLYALPFSRQFWGNGVRCIVVVDGVVSVTCPTIAVRF